MSLDDFAVGTRALTGLLEIFLSESVFEGPVMTLLVTGRARSTNPVAPVTNSS